MDFLLDETNLFHVDVGIRKKYIYMYIIEPIQNYILIFRLHCNRVIYRHGGETYKQAGLGTGL